MALSAPPPAVKQQLPNGAFVYVQNRPTPGRMSVVLTFSSVGVADTDGMEGLRHLWEHFAARGPRRDLDGFLEARGCVLTAYTTRDATQFVIDGPSEQVAGAMEAVNRMLNPLVVTDEELARELRVIREEDALRTWQERVTAAAWRAGYGEMGLDPFGNLADMAKVQPADLMSLHRAQLAGNGLSLVVTGDLEASITAERAIEIVRRLPSGAERLDDDAEEAVVAASARVDLGHGRGAFVGGMGDPGTVAALAAGLAIAVQRPGVEVVYTPSVRPGLVTLVSADRADLDWIDARTDAERLAFFGVGQSLVQQWVTGLQQDNVRSARLLGLLLVQRPGLDLEMLRNQALTMTEEQFLAGWGRFVRENGVVVEDGR